jgi:hypothetical protein
MTRCGVARKRSFEWRASIAPVLTTKVPSTAGGRIHSPSAVRTSRPGSADCARKVRKLLSVCGAKPHSFIRYGRRLTRNENIADTAQLMGRLAELVPLIAGHLPGAVTDIRLDTSTAA